MKKILFILLLFVNLQCVIHQDGGIELRSFTTAEAQHMTREPGDNCYSADIGWYHSPISDCSEPESIEYCCQYCTAHFADPGDRDYHQDHCSKNPSNLQCSWCQSTFGSDSELNSHKENCGPEMCNYSGCGMRFKTKSELDEHMKSHENKDKDKDKGGSAGGSGSGGSGGSGGGSGSGGSGGGGTGGGSTRGSSKSPRKGPRGLWCQTQDKDCVPTAIANFAFLTGGQSSQGAAQLWNRIKDSYESTYNDEDYFDHSGIKVKSIPSLLAQFGVIDNQAYETIADIYVIAEALDNNQSVLGILNPTGDVDGNDYSHAVNILGYNKKNNGAIESFKVFDPLECKDSIVSNLDIVCRGYIKKTAK